MDFSFLRRRKDRVTKHHDSGPAPRVLIAGAYGKDNIGDESILSGIAQDIRATLPAARITVLTWAPEPTAHLLGVRTVRPTVGSVLREIARTDIILCGGGSILAEYYNPQASLPEQLKGFPGYPLSVLTLGKLWRRKVMVYAVGVEPMASPWFRRWTALSLKMADAFTVRDLASKQLLGEWGDNSGVTVTVDPAFNLSPLPAEEAAELLRVAGLALPDGAPCIGISMAYEPRFVRCLDEQLDFLVQLAQGLVEEWGAYIVLIPMNIRPDLDREGLSRIAGRLPAGNVTLLEGASQPAEILAVLSRLDLVISSRMHSLILAAVANVPCAALSRGPKIDAFARQFGTEPIARAEDLDLAGARARIGRILQAPAEQKAALAAHLSEVRSRSQLSREILARLAVSARGRGSR
jgi:polysaccharide pyruvyl transferase CsaB